MKAIHPIMRAALVSLLLAGLPAKANLFHENDPHFGSNSLTVDTRTGLTWLDLPFSLNLSYLQAEAATQPGGQFEGFRHATAEEVLSLYNSAGFGQGFIAQSSPDFPNVVSLISLIGATSSTGALGITGTPDYSGSLVAMDYASYGWVGGVPGYFVTGTLPTTYYGLDTQFSTVGNWMVLVPEPSANALVFAGGALTLLLSRRKV